MPLVLGAALLFSGCIATEKQVDLLETDITKRSAWTDERIVRLDAELESVRAENEALRIRMDDLTDQLASLGGEVSNRLTELAESDEVVAQQAREAARSATTAAQGADDLEAKREKDREEMLTRMNVILEEVLRENEKLAARVAELENSALTFGTEHTVRSGESVAGIAAKYGVSVDAIVQANALPNASRISVGQKLIIPSK
ncbi:MAG: LysM peptidoglycan-binding domain-containing protein [Gemmatimonadetes bacterium]|nr:LysM peptidoglycan-binding domain-containing protein [Gemmatimonadota bacterium]